MFQQMIFKKSISGFFFGFLRTQSSKLRSRFYTIPTRYVICLEFINQSSDSNESVSPTRDEIPSEIIAGCLEEPKDTKLEETYAEVVKSHRETGETKEKSHRVKTDNISQKLSQRNSDVDGFIGVNRRSNRIKKFFLTGIDERVKEGQILSYLEQRNIRPTYISTFRSRRRGTISAKLHIPSTICSIIQGEEFWPKFVTCRPWQQKNSIEKTAERNTEINTAHASA